MKLAMFEYCSYTAFIFLSFVIDLSKNYKYLNLEDPALCSPIVKRRIRLESELESGLIVSMNTLKDHSLDWDKNFFCKFQVEVSKNNKIFAVIQNLSFRKNIETNECIDYLHWKRADGTISRKFCGNITAMIEMDSKIVNKITPFPINSFDDYTGQLDVNIYIAREALSLSENMDLKIAFTSYRPCTAARLDDMDCGDGHYHNCIYTNYINDSIFNCPYFDCVDESGCATKPPVDNHKKSVGNKVVISTVTVLFIAFVLFICFIWLCRKYQKLCWSEQFSGTNNTENRRPSTVIEMNQPVMPDRASAAAVSTGSSEEDKDLPPSYESLFPNR